MTDGQLAFTLDKMKSFGLVDSGIALEKAASAACRSTR